MVMLLFSRGIYALEKEDKNIFSENFKALDTGPFAGGRGVSPWSVLRDSGREKTRPGREILLEYQSGMWGMPL